MLTPENFAFARQAGATHIVAHLVDYFKGGGGNPKDNQPTGGNGGWGLAGDPDRLWSLEEMLSIKKQIEEAGLVWEAIENFDPAHWHDVLLDGPKRDAQMENVKTMIRTAGEAGIATIGYNFSLAGVCGRITGPFARGERNRWEWKAASMNRYPWGWHGTWFTTKGRRPGRCHRSAMRNSGGEWRIF